MKEIQFSMYLFSFVGERLRAYLLRRRGELPAPARTQPTLGGKMMFNLKPHKSTGTITKVLCALSLSVACAPAWSDDVQPKFEMAVYSDAPQGMKILNGKYDQAIEKINTASSSAYRLHVQTNLCVAYVKAGDIDAAESVCEEAVVAAKSLNVVRASSFIGQSSAKVRARYLAVALSNRGVVKAVRGELQAAKEDFDAALAQRSGISTVETNIARLEIVNEESA
jgi:tetratricopeptide (TPR) repeat protein